MNPPTPLMAAAKASVSCELVRLLLSRGADSEEGPRGPDGVRLRARGGGRRAVRPACFFGTSRPGRLVLYRGGAGAPRGRGRAHARPAARRAPRRVLEALQQRPEARAPRAPEALLAAARGRAAGSAGAALPPGAPRAPPQTESRGGAGDRGAGSDERQVTRPRTRKDAHDAAPLVLPDEPFGSASSGSSPTP